MKTRLMAALKQQPLHTLTPQGAHRLRRAPPAPHRHRAMKADTDAVVRPLRRQDVRDDRPLLVTGSCWSFWEEKVFQRHAAGFSITTTQ